MESGRHTQLPETELAAFVDGLRFQAMADGGTIRIEAVRNGNGTVDLVWAVGPAQELTDVHAPSATPRPVAPVPPSPEVAIVPPAVATVPPSPAPPSSQPPSPETAAVAAAAFVLGKLSEKFEVGKRGVGTVSGGQGDPGGVSYGCYQMTSRPNGGTVARFLRDEAGRPFADRFAGLQPGTAAFSAAWRALAEEQPETFRAAQHAFIRRTHFDPMCDALKRTAGLDPLARSHALQDCIWSTAVQHGGGSRILLTVCDAIRSAGTPRPEDGVRYDEALIRAIYAERGRRREDGKLAHFPSSSPAVQSGVARRFERELEDALKMLAGAA